MNTLKKNNVTRQNISLYPEDWDVVEWVMKQNGLRKYSAALRHIINDYRTRHTPSIPPTDQQFNQGKLFLD